jgi:hypothetical protein
MAFSFSEIIKAHSLVYVTKDIERALGLSPTEGYNIFAASNDYARHIQSLYPKNVYLSAIQTSNTLSILRDRFILEQLTKLKIKSVLFFKNSTLLEKEASKIGVQVLNPRAKLAEKIENKISQLSWLGSLASKYMPPYEVRSMKSIKWEKKPLVIQWEHGHTGDGTILINSQSELESLIQKFPERLARVTEYILGPSFTLSAVAAQKKTFIGNISYQITGLSPFTDNVWSTVGNDWSIPYSFFSEKEIRYILKITKDVGEKMIESGWSGLFGLDFIYDQERNKILLLEINARQPASVTFESKIQERMRQSDKEMTIFEAHLLALLGEKMGKKIIEINDGAQIIQRVTKTIRRYDRKKIDKLESAGYQVIEYNNTEPNSDLLRIQSKAGIMENHGKLNKRGLEIDLILH